jgi:hypothetical protein
LTFASGFSELTNFDTIFCGVPEQNAWFGGKVLLIMKWQPSRGTMESVETKNTVAQFLGKNTNVEVCFWRRLSANIFTQWEYVSLLVFAY